MILLDLGEVSNSISINNQIRESSLKLIPKDVVGEVDGLVEVEVKVA